MCKKKFIGILFTRRDHFFCYHTNNWRFTFVFVYIWKGKNLLSSCFSQCHSVSITELRNLSLFPSLGKQRMVATAAAAAAAKSLQSCPTLCDPIDGSPPGSPVPGIFQARTLEQKQLVLTKGIHLNRQ